VRWLLRLLRRPEPLSPLPLIRLRCEAVPDEVPLGRHAVCGLLEGHGGDHLWVLL
jgi:hypothetical protein